MLSLHLSALSQSGVHSRWIYTKPWISGSDWNPLVSRDWFGVFLTLDKYLANVDIHCFGNGTYLYFWVSFHTSHSYQYSFIFRNMALVSCFPISSHGIMFALIELCRKALHWVWNRCSSKIVQMWPKPWKFNGQFFTNSGYKWSQDKTKLWFAIHFAHFYIRLGISGPFSALRQSFMPD